MESGYRTQCPCGRATRNLPNTLTKAVGTELTTRFGSERVLASETGIWPLISRPLCSALRFSGVPHAEARTGAVCPANWDTANWCPRLGCIRIRVILWSPFEGSSIIEGQSVFLVRRCESFLFLEKRRWRSPYFWRFGAFVCRRRQYGPRYLRKR